MEYTCIECENLYDDTDGDTDERMCNRCLEEITNQEYSYTEDRKRVADRSVGKIRKMAIYEEATREECLEGVIYEMSAKIDELGRMLQMVV